MGTGSREENASKQEAAENSRSGTRALAFLSLSSQIGPGGWQWTDHSPTGSGPEGSSPNELRFGSLVSLPPFTLSRMQGRARSGAGRHRYPRIAHERRR